MASFTVALFLYVIVDGIHGSRIGNLMMGKPHNTIRILNGTPGNITQYPYMAIYRTKNETLGCGAAIVHERYVVTAAHCVVFRSSYDDFANLHRVTVGTDSVIEGGEDYEIEKIHVHLGFYSALQKNIVENDVAVIKLKDSIKFSDRAKPIKMADTDLELKNGDVLTAIGFGLTENGTTSDNLLAVNLTYLEKRECQKSHFQKYDMKLTRNMLCGVGDNGKSSCHGDSGGPLAFNGTLVGITSWGNAMCGTPCGKLMELPTVYVRVSQYRRYINGIINDE